MTCCCAPHGCDKANNKIATGVAIVQKHQHKGPYPTDLTRDFGGASSAPQWLNLQLRCIGYFQNFISTAYCYRRAAKHINTTKFIDYVYNHFYPLPCLSPVRIGGSGPCAPRGYASVEDLLAQTIYFAKAWSSTRLLIYLAASGNLSLFCRKTEDVWCVWWKKDRNVNYSTASSRPNGSTTYYFAVRSHLFRFFATLSRKRISCRCAQSIRPYAG